ncbi:dihydropteroate synthase, partial [Gregarina niphandrodes]
MGEVYIAFGSNLREEHRLEDLESGVRLVGKLEELSYAASSHLYETRAAYGSHGDYLNAVVRYSVDRSVCTEIGLSTLLRSLQSIERQVGRTTAQGRNRDRVLDVDLVSVVVSRSASSVALDRLASVAAGGKMATTRRFCLHSNGVPVHLDLPQLQLPHPRAHERRFVLQPLRDLTAQRIIRTPDGLWASPSELLLAMADRDLSDARYSPIKRLWATTKFAYAPQSPCTMGILNITPDSFSEADPLVASDTPASQPRVDLVKTEARLRRLHAQHFDVIDVGFESTRPNQPLISSETELLRLEAAARLLFHTATELQKPLSIDTRRPAVFKRALELAQLCAAAAAAGDSAQSENSARREYSAEDTTTDTVKITEDTRASRHFCGTWNNVTGTQISDEDIKWCVAQHVTYICAHWEAFDGVTNARGELCDCPWSTAMNESTEMNEPENDNTPQPLAVSVMSPHGTPVTVTPPSAILADELAGRTTASPTSVKGRCSIPTPCKHVTDQIERIRETLNQFVSRWFRQGGLRWRLVIDPGLGFGIDKRVSQALLHTSQDLFSDHILLLGFSKK